jgi:hypothetical protein
MTRDQNSRNSNTSSHNGGPSEERSSVRKGQIDWVAKISKPTEYKSWVFKFKVGAATYLSKELYPNNQERRYAWLNALIRAASLGEFEEMNHLLELYDSDGVQCEDILGKLEERFLPAMEVEKKKATTAFMAYARGRKPLSQATKELKVIILECHKAGYKPDVETVKAKYESLLLPQELPLVRLYQKNDDGDGSELDKLIRALEGLGKDQEGVHANGNGVVLPEFAGGAFKKKGSAGPRRKGYVHWQELHQRSDKTSKSVKTCESCGKACPMTRGEPKEKCYAYGKECRKCGKKGHFESKCRSTTKASAAAAGGSAEGF